MARDPRLLLHPSVGDCPAGYGRCPCSLGSISHAHCLAELRTTDKIKEARVRRIGYVAALGYIATIFAANWLIQHVGVVHVGFGLMAPAGVYAVGVAFTLRDITHRTLGPSFTVAAILVGAGLSYLVSPAFAAASAVAFLASELADFAVYTPLERRSWLGAVALSNTVGLAVDSSLFLTIAFGSLEFFWGQVVGKAWMTLLAVVLLAGGRRAFLARKPHARMA